jgi:formylglycine-generating enzyme required for sulfatase activity
VPGGTFFRSYDGVNFIYKSYPATVSSFSLDTYEITVGRFRNFVNAYPSSKPAPGAGKNPNNPQDPGWDAEWNTKANLLPADQNELKKWLKSCNFGDPTWTDQPWLNEKRPIDCLNWYEAFAFCIWDGGRLPTLAEWLYAASGGGGPDGQRTYPWANPPDSMLIDIDYAVYCKGSCDKVTQDVGSRSPKGDGKWGHADLAGNVFEWTLDAHNGYEPWYFINPCVDCADLAPTGYRVMRGSGASNKAMELLIGRQPVGAEPAHGGDFVGARCARSAQ